MSTGDKLVAGAGICFIVLTLFALGGVLNAYGNANTGPSPNELRFALGLVGFGLVLFVSGAIAYFLENR